MDSEAELAVQMGGLISDFGTAIPLDDAARESCCSERRGDPESLFLRVRWQVGWRRLVMQESPLASDLSVPHPATHHLALDPLPQPCKNDVFIFLRAACVALDRRCFSNPISTSCLKRILLGAMRFCD